MRFTSVTAAAIGFFAASTSATLALGKQGGKNVAWIEGDEVCGGTVSINSQSDNPCGIPFKLRNGYTYSLVNCGGSDFGVVNAGDGSFNAHCIYDDEFLGCDVEKVWRC